MTDPYAGVRAAVAAWSPPTSSPAVMADGSPAAAAGNDSAVGVYVATLGALVATYPAVGYARWVDWLSAKCSEVGSIEVYAGAVDPHSRLTGHGDGSESDWEPNSPRFLPQGVPLLVVWYVSDAAQTASCNAGFRQAA